MSHTFDREPDFVNFVTQRLGDSGLDPEIAGAIAQCVASDFNAEEHSAPRPGRLRATIPFKRWAIHNDDLRFLDTLADALLTAMKAGLAGVAIPTSAGVSLGLATIGVETLRLLRRVNSKGVVLDRLPFLVLMTLKRLGPMTTGDLARHLTPADQEGGEGISLDQVEKTVRAMSDVVMNDGSKRALVVQDNGGLWRATNV